MRSRLPYRTSSLDDDALAIVIAILGRSTYTPQSLTSIYFDWT